MSLAISTIAIAALVRATGTAVRAAITSEAYNTAILLAETKLDEVRRDGVSFYADEKGDFDPPHEDFTWHVGASESADITGLYTVAVEINWPHGGAYVITTFIYEAALYVETELEL